MIEANRVDLIIRDCLYRSHEVPDHKPPQEAIMVEGLLTKFAFHPQRLEAHRAEIRGMLAQLPDEFMKDKGRGWSFLNLCVDKEGQQWVNEHRVMEALVVVGIGLGLVQLVPQRSLWAALPGGLPYVVVDLGGEGKALIRL